MIYEMDFLYCPKCAGKFQKSGPKHLTCTDCGLEYYINPKLTNAVILKNRQGKILLARRAKDPQKGKWDLPGGFVDANETVEESIHREIHEELGIQVHSLKYLSSFYNDYEYAGIVYNTICVLFEAQMDDEDAISPADDVSDVAYFTASDLPYEDFAFPGMSACLKNV